MGLGKGGGSVGQDGIFSVATDAANNVRNCCGIFLSSSPNCWTKPHPTEWDGGCIFGEVFSRWHPILVCQNWGTGNDEITDITVDSDGNTYVVGNFQYEVEIGSIDNIPVDLYSNNPTTFFVAKYNSNGVLQWAKAANYNYGGFEIGHIATSLDQRNNGNQIIVTGFVPFDVNDTDVFITLLDNHGDLVDGWRSIGNEIEIGTGIRFDNNSNIVLTGHFYNELNLPGNLMNIFMETLMKFLWQSIPIT